MKFAKSLKVLSLTALVGVASVGVASAKSVDDVDLSQQPVDMPTLDYLGSQGVIYTLGSTPVDINGDGDANDALDSGYSFLNSVSNSDNVVTKYAYDESSATLTAVEYEVKLSTDTYGSNNNAGERYFKWSKNAENGNYTFGAAYENNAHITVQLPSSSQARLDFSGNSGNFSGDFVGLSTMINVSTGGAIYNKGTINSLSGNIVANISSFSSANGGGVYNEGTITNLNSNFIGNYASGSSNAYGGAIANRSTISNILGDFIGNYAKSGEARGGALYNSGNGTINSIIGDMVGNYVTTSSRGLGGAIYNYNRIDNIVGDFVGNYVFSSGDKVQGGAVYNEGSMTSITGDFIGNYAKSHANEAKGGAIFNYSSYGKISKLSGQYINNSVYTSSGFAAGGAIYNDNRARIETIKGAVFSGNSSEGTTWAEGGAIWNCNSAYIGNISATFINNSTYSQNATAQGGALYNGEYSSINSIVGNFVENSTTGKDANGGAIFNNLSTITSITGDFVRNSATATSLAKGGAIYNTNTIGTISGSLIGNYAKSESGTAQGGAIYTTQSIHMVADNKAIEIKDNYTESAGVRDNNAIFVDSSTATLTFDAKNNGIITLKDNIKGQSGYTLSLTGDSTGTINLHNFASDANLSVSGVGKVGLVDNEIKEYTFNSITSDANVKYVLDVDFTSAVSDKFIVTGSSSGTVKVDSLNILSADWDKLYNDGETKIQVLDITSGNLQLALGDGANALSDTILKTIEEVTSENVTKDVLWNDIFETTKTTKDYYGTISLGKSKTDNDSIVVNVSNFDTTVITTPNGDTLQLWNQLDTTEAKNFNFDAAANKYELTANLGVTKGSELNVNGVLAEDGTRSTIDFANYSGFEISDAVHLNINNVNLEKSSALIKNTNADSVINLVNVNIKNNAGAIRTSGDINLIADGANVELSGNTGDVIYLDNTDKTLTINTKNSGSTTISNTINGASGYNVAFTGDATGVVNVNDIISNADISLDNTTLNLASDSVLNNNNLVLNSGTLSMINGQAGIARLSSLHLYGTTDFLADVDLANTAMDRISTDAYGFDPAAKLNVVGMNLISDAASDVTSILFADNSLKDHVDNQVSEIGIGIENNYQRTAYAPIYKYNVSYENREDAGYFVFTRPSPGGGGGGSAESFNPAVLGSSVGASVGALGTMNTTMHFAFQNADNYMNIPHSDRIAIRDRNKLALAQASDATNVGAFSPLFTKNEYGSVWFKPYASFESVGLKNGPKVSNITYGSLVGFDTELESIKGGWDRTFTGYIGYNGASQRYSGVDTYQNGGLIGGTMTLYKGNFFNATTLSVGASVASNTTMYGHDNYAMLLSGIGNKTGYNFEFNEGKVILQPSMLMSYTFVNTFDYTNAAGVRIDNDPLHAIQLSPGLKLIGNTKNGWQPYLAVSMVWNLMGKSDATANGVRLPQMSIKPYVQYGLGVQKRIKDNFMGFGQAMVHSGGRNGISLTAGFRWAIGRDDSKYEKTQRNSDKKQTLTIKQNTPSNAAILKQVQDSNKQISSAGKTIMKQMTLRQRVVYGGKYVNTSRTAQTGSLRQY